MDIQYGCKVVTGKGLQKHFSDEVISNLNNIGMKKLLILKRRKKGLTSSGSEASCHNNVELLVASLGGKHKHGYLLEGNTDDKKSVDENGKITEFSLVYHSAWLTPEENLVCVTPRKVSTSKKIDLTEDDIYFFLFDGEQKQSVMYRDLIFIGRSIKQKGVFCLLSKDVNEYAYDPTPYTKHYNQLMYDRRIFENSGMSKEKFEDFARKSLVSNPQRLAKQFSKKSILTKRTLFQIIKGNLKESLDKNNANSTTEELITKGLYSTENLLLDYALNVPTNKKQKKRFNKVRESLTFKFA